MKSLKQDFSHITPPEGARVVPLSQGKYALVDEEDYDRVSQYNWCLLKKNYATAIVEGIRTKMHRYILKLVNPKIYVDHKNHNGLDNRKCNLREATPQQNSANCKPVKSASSKYKGVHWSKVKSKWVSNIQQKDKKKYLGEFKTEEDAARAYDAKAKELYGEFAYLNFKD